MHLVALSSKAQLKVQEMAFALVAMMIFFVLVGLFFMAFLFSQTKNNVQQLYDEKAAELALKLADLPEFALTSGAAKCEKCIDLDKLMAFKERLNKTDSYNDFWGFDIDALQVKILYPIKTGECTTTNYPRCNTLTLIQAPAEYNFRGSFVPLCRKETEKGGYTRCEIGKILISAKQLP